MKTIARFRDTYEAHLAKGLLESQGIPAVVIDEHIVWMNWLYSTAVGGVKVQVPDDAIEKAKEILNKDYTPELQSIPESSIPSEHDDKCPRCGSESVILNRYSIWWLIPSLAFTAPIFFRHKPYMCNHCGHKW